MTMRYIVILICTEGTHRAKGKHLVLVTDPEIVEEAYAFDNPCFKDVTPAVGRSFERSNVLHAQNVENQMSKEGNKWSTPWSNLHIGKSNEKKRTLDDSCLGAKAGRVSVVGLRSRDFTGLGFNVCGNMREGIFVKDLLHRGPASESGRIHPGDRIISMKISFRSMVYEDALTILSYASPYDVELEVESGSVPENKPTTLLKKSVSPSPGHLYHPLYRSQSIPELLTKPTQPQTNGRKHTSRRLFDQHQQNQSLNDSSYSNSTLKSRNSIASSGTPQGSYSNVELRIGNASGNNSRPSSGAQLAKFGIKVLPALDGTVHRVETQNEHNTNLERRHSKKQLEGAGGKGDFGSQAATTNGVASYGAMVDGGKMEKKIEQDGRRRDIERESLQQRSREPMQANGIDVPDRASEIVKEEKNQPNMSIPSEVPAEVHNAAVAARRNRKSAHIELMEIPKEPQQETQQQSMQETMDVSGAKSPSKGKRKAPAPPSRTLSGEIPSEDKTSDDDKAMNGISDIKEDEKRITSHDDVEKMTSGKQLESANRMSSDETKTPTESKVSNESPMKKRSSTVTTNDRRVSESDTDSEIQNNFRTIELNPADITVHRTPVPEDSKPPNTLADHHDDEDEIYRKAASLGDLSRYEAATAAAKSSSLERAQSLDMTDSSSKSKRKAPLVPAAEDILAESTEDLTKLDQLDASRSKLKKSSEWGTLEDAIWISPDSKKQNLSEPPEELYAGKKEVKEEPFNKVHVNFDHPCDLSYHRTIRVQSPFETHHAKPVMSSLPEPTEPQTPTKTYVTEIRVSSTEDQQVDETNSPKSMQVVTPNGKLPAGKKPPVPPRRSDASRYVTTSSGDRQVDNSDKEQQRKSWTQTNQPAVTSIVLQSSAHGDDRPAGN
ncbi:hypothetical protein QAD02_009481 [Eretmocerus hayati]|uniref:Uncharacterized protein n=1 Tax=Eretmocerus hayati TaxID=131215 RepID=A0ACC2NAQ0_9HYME|nr:hypothetical protein QAD02_009481 [Eretmocerus hayati]